MLSQGLCLTPVFCALTRSMSDPGVLCSHKVYVRPRCSVLSQGLCLTPVFCALTRSMSDPGVLCSHKAYVRPRCSVLSQGLCLTPVFCALTRSMSDPGVLCSHKVYVWVGGGEGGPQLSSIAELCVPGCEIFFPIIGPGKQRLAWS